MLIEPNKSYARQLLTKTPTLNLFVSSKKKFKNYANSYAPKALKFKRVSASTFSLMAFYIIYHIYGND